MADERTDPEVTDAMDDEMAGIYAGLVDAGVLDDPRAWRISEDDWLAVKLVNDGDAPCPPEYVDMGPAELAAHIIRDRLRARVPAHQGEPVAWQEVARRAYAQGAFDNANEGMRAVFGSFDEWWAQHGRTIREACAAPPESMAITDSVVRAFKEAYEADTGEFVGEGLVRHWLGVALFASVAERNGDGTLDAHTGEAE